MVADAPRLRVKAGCVLFELHDEAGIKKTQLCTDQLGQCATLLRLRHIRVEDKSHFAAFLLPRRAGHDLQNYHPSCGHGDYASRRSNQVFRQGPPRRILLVKEFSR